LASQCEEFPKWSSNAGHIYGCCSRELNNVRKQQQQEIEEEVLFLANPFVMFVITTDYVTFILHIGQ
jgi:hypothetical protein